jgi:hypothetical protein
MCTQKGQGYMSQQNSRLALAADLLKLDDGVDVLKYLNSLPPKRRRELQVLVDWVEEHDAAYQKELAAAALEKQFCRNQK